MEHEAALSTYHIFNAVAETGNLSKAAKLLYISQPAISRAVSKLEHSLSVKLFIRSSRGVRLTEEGRLLYEHTKTAFDSLRQVEEDLRRMNNLGIRTLRIGASSMLCKHVLIPKLQYFIQEYPHIQVTICCRSSSELMSLLEKKEIDIALISEPDSLHALEFFPIAEVENTLVASEGYLSNLQLRMTETAGTVTAKNRRCTTKKTPGVIQALLKEGVLLLPGEQNFSRCCVNRYFNSQHLEAGRILELDDMQQLIDFSKVGLGIGCLIKEFIPDELAEHSLIELPLPEKFPKRSIGFAYSKTSLQAVSVHTFIDFYKGDTK